MTRCGSVLSTKGFWGQGSGGVSGTNVVTQVPARRGCGGRLARVHTVLGGRGARCKAEAGHCRRAAEHGEAKPEPEPDQLPPGEQLRAEGTASPHGRWGHLRQAPKGSPRTPRIGQSPGTTGIATSPRMPAARA